MSVEAASEDVEIEERLIDCHTHAISPFLPDLGARFGSGPWPTVHSSGDRGVILVGGSHFRDIDHRCWSAARRVEDMNTAGVSVQVVSPVPVTLCHGAPARAAAELARAQNDLLAKLVADAPDRLVGLGSVPLQDTDAAVKEVERCCNQLGFAGVEIGTQVGEMDLDAAVLRPFFEAAAALHAVVFVHPLNCLGGRFSKLGLGFGLGMPVETALAGASLLVGGVLGDVEQLRVCLAHGGGALPAVLPRIEQGWRLAVKDELGRSPGELARLLWADSLTYDSSSLWLSAERFGADHIVLGTDYPFAAREDPPGDVLAQGMRQAEQGALLEGARHANAQRLLATVLAARGRSLVAPPARDSKSARIPSPGTDIKPSSAALAEDIGGS